MFACFFVGDDRNIVTKFLDACEFFATSEVRASPKVSINVILQISFCLPMWQIEE